MAKKITRSMLRRMILNEVARMSEDVSSTGDIEAAFASFPGMNDDIRRSIITNLEKELGIRNKNLVQDMPRFRGIVEQIGDPEEYVRQKFIQAAMGAGGSQGSMLKQMFDQFGLASKSLYEIVSALSENGGNPVLGDRLEDSLKSFMRGNQMAEILSSLRAAV